MRINNKMVTRWPKVINPKTSVLVSVCDAIRTVCKSPTCE